MRGRGIWLQLTAISCVLAMTAWSPAFGRGGSTGSSFFAHTAHAAFRGGHIAPFGRSIAAQGRALSAHIARTQAVLPAAIGPYSWSIGAAAIEPYPAGNATPPDPYVIVVSQLSPVPIRPPPVAAPDAVAAGCHPIPNGYHCDAPTAPGTATGGATRNTP